MEFLVLGAVILSGSFAQSLLLFCIAFFAVRGSEADKSTYVVNRYDTLLTFDELQTR